ncbi:MAG: hypothetical protein KGL39_22520 [Patescibacteria group bacterium]|nr:hypothetical protein [Patescibacteria group bacterium]
MAAARRYEDMGRNEFRRPCPTDLIQLAASHSTVNHYLRYWEKGAIPWEHMLLSLAIELAHRDVEERRYFENAIGLASHPPAVINPPEAESYFPKEIAKALARRATPADFKQVQADILADNLAASAHTKPAAGQCRYGECDGTGTYKGLFKTETCRCKGSNPSPVTS